MKMIIILILLFSINLLCVGCIKCHQRSKWTKYKSLKKLWPRLKEEKIESIILCDGDLKTDVESWLVFGEVEQENLEGFKNLLNDQCEDRFNFPVERYSIYSCNQGMLKIVTNKGKYAVPGVDRGPQNNWREYSTLVALWPRLQKEKIKSIGFCRELPGVDIDIWHTWHVPKENLDECVRLIDNTIQNADHDFKWGPYYEERMKIITNKGKYLVPAEIERCNTNSPRLFGNGWSSPELGEFLKKCGFCNSDANQPGQNRRITPER
jgi:hypothetical protein